MLFLNCIIFILLPMPPYRHTVLRQTTIPANVILTNIFPAKVFLTRKLALSYTIWFDSLWQFFLLFFWEFALLGFCFLFGIRLGFLLFRYLSFGEFVFLRVFLGIFFASFLFRNPSFWEFFLIYFIGNSSFFFVFGKKILLKIYILGIKA